MRFALAVVLVLVLPACGDKDNKGDPDGSDPLPDSSSDTSRLDRPGTLERPPTGGLPAELRPPR